MQSSRQELNICFSAWQKLFFFFKICETEVDPTPRQRTEHRQNRTLHCRVVKKLISLLPLLKHVGDTEVLSVLLLHLFLVKNRNSKTKGREMVTAGATRSKYKECFLILDAFPVQSIEKRCKCLRRNEVSVPLCLLLVAKCYGSLPEAH